MQKLRSGFDTVAGEALRGNSEVFLQLARQSFGGRDPVGERIKWGPRDDPETPWMTVVGVVANVMHSGSLTAWSIPPAVYLPLAQHPLSAVTAVVRASSDPHGLATPLRDEVRALDPDVPAYAVRTLAEARRFDAAPIVLLSAMFGTFALVTVILAAPAMYASERVARLIEPVGLPSL